MSEMEISKPKLNGRDFFNNKKYKACPKARLMSGISLSDRKNYSFDEYAIAIDVIKRCLMGIKDDIAELVSEGYINVSDIDKTQELREQELTGRLKRYCRSEHRQKFVSFPEARYLSIPDEWEFAFDGCDNVKVQPDAMFKTQDYKTGRAILTLVYYRTGLPDVTQKTGNNRAEDDKSLYWLLRFGEEEAKTFLAEGEECEIVACHYFLKKKTDKKGCNYWDDFFDGKGGNVVEISEIFSNVENAPRSEIDMHFEKVFEAFSLGIECSGDDCKQCVLNDVCNYVKAPDVYEMKEIKKRKKPNPSPEQQAVIDAIEGDFKVNASAGGGKTECLKERTIHIIKTEMEKYEQQGMTPNAALHEAAKGVLMITFTNAGANEMKERVIGGLMTEFDTSSDEVSETEQESEEDTKTDPDQQ